MATTYTLISSNVLSTSAASVTFSSIPSTYTDLVLKVSARTDESYQRAELFCEFNSDTGTNYSTTWILGYSSSPSSARASNASYLYSNEDFINGNTTTSNTFSNTEIYIPNYMASQNKPIGGFSVLENNSSTDGQYGVFVNAGLWRNTAAITSIKLSTQSTKNFVSGSSFRLYGIKNS